MNHTIYSTLGSLPFLGATEFPTFPSSLQTILKPMTLSAWLELWAAMKLQRISDPVTFAIQNELLLPSSKSFNWKVLRPWIIHVISRILRVVLCYFVFVSMNDLNLKTGFDFKVIAWRHHVMGELHQ